MELYEESFGPLPPPHYEKLYSQHLNQTQPSTATKSAITPHKCHEIQVCVRNHNVPETCNNVTLSIYEHWDTALTEPAARYHIQVTKAHT